MRRAFPLFVVAIAAGCSSRSDTGPVPSAGAPPARAESPPVSAKAAPPPAMPTAKSRPTPVTPARTFDEAAAGELYAAFQRNPLAAREKYAGVRWRVTATPVEIDELNVWVEIVVRPGRVSRDQPGDGPNGRLVPGFTIRTPMPLDRDDALKILKGVPYTFEATVHDYRPDTRLPDTGIKLADARLVSPKPAP